MLGAMQIMMLSLLFFIMRMIYHNQIKPILVWEKFKFSKCGKNISLLSLNMLEVFNILILVEIE